MKKNRLMLLGVIVFLFSGCCGVVAVPLKGIVRNHNSNLE